MTHLIRYEMLQFEYLWRVKKATYFHNVSSNRAPPSVVHTPQFLQKIRTNFLHFAVKHKSQYLRSCFFSIAIKYWNDLNIFNPISKRIKFQTVKKSGPICLNNFKLLITYVMEPITERLSIQY